MGYVKPVLAMLAAALVAAFLHYNLPQRDIVQIVGTEVSREDVQQPDGTLATRDVRFINARTEAGRPRVYRNEDTGWRWPPYLKFDTGNLQAEAQSMAKADQWVAVTHYGWRIPMFSIFPNAVRIRAVEGPEVQLIPWFNIVALALLAALAWGIWRRVQRFRKRRIDPLLDDIDEEWDEARGFWRRLAGR
ncbi:MAG: DUF1523 domain-containing protein [Alphaproteobacteria bacterium HGW-Alphaproteobacteria-2]|nr:MAG: DUF1523 domain-containing protein [Alphaproteobacteria bacterium HGW-Alphaproteobacteria-2]